MSETTIEIDGENGDAARLPESTIRDRHAHDHKAREDAARQWFTSKMPGLVWDDQPEAVRMAWRAAVTEKHYPRTCTECGHTGDTHPPTSLGGHRFTTKEAS